MGKLRPFAIPVAVLLLVEAWFTVTGRRSDALAPPSAIAGAGFRALANGSLLYDTGQTLAATLIGLAIGGGFGTVCGMVLGLSRTGAAVTSPTIELLRPIPSVALIPLSMLVFGFGYRMEIAIVAFATFWPCLILAMAGASNVDKRLIEVSEMLHLSLAQRLYKIVVPSALPRLFVALRLGITIGLVVAVTVEIAANPQGIGNALMVSQQALRPDLMLANLLWLGVTGWGLNAALLQAERRLFVGRGNVADATT